MDTFGLGAGYLEPEFRALGAPFEQRGAVTDEAIRVLKALWTMDMPAHRGGFPHLKVSTHIRVLCRSLIRRSSSAVSAHSARGARFAMWTAGLVL